MDEIEVVVDRSVGGQNPKFEGNFWEIDAQGALTVFSGSRSSTFRQLGSFNVGKWVTVTRLTPAEK